MTVMSRTRSTHRWSSASSSTRVKRTPSPNPSLPGQPSQGPKIHAPRRGHKQSRPYKEPERQKDRAERWPIPFWAEHAASCEKIMRPTGDSKIFNFWINAAKRSPIRTR